MGCLRLPLRLLGAALLAILVAAAWLYRHQIRDYLAPYLPGRAAAAPAVGRPTETAVRTGRDKIDSLNAWRADSIILTANEMASLIGGGLDGAVRKQLDSLQVRLEDGRLGVTAVIHTGSIPDNVLGPLKGMVGPTERVEAAGPVQVARPGLAVWEVEELKLGSFPFPSEMIPPLLERALGTPRSAVLPFVIPDGIGGVRIRPGGVTLYGAKPRR